MRTRDIKKRVNRGIDFLNYKLGRSWFNRIRLQHFQIRSSCNCILGQLYGGYVKGQEELGIGQEECAKELGLDIETNSEIYCSYDQLQQAWETALKELKGVKSRPD